MMPATTGKLTAYDQVTDCPMWQVRNTLVMCRADVCVCPNEDGSMLEKLFSVQAGLYCFTAFTPGCLAAVLCKLCENLCCGMYVNMDCYVFEVFAFDVCSQLIVSEK